MTSMSPLLTTFITVSLAYYSYLAPIDDSLVNINFNNDWDFSPQVVDEELESSANTHDSTLEKQSKENEVELEPSAKGDESTLKIHSEENEMAPRILRLSPAGANLVNYTVQFIPLGTVLSSPTVYYPFWG